MKNISLVSYPLAWVASTKLKLPDEPVSLEVIAQWPIITYLRHTRPYDLVQEILARENIAYGRLFASASVSTMITMILDGVGIGVIPAAVVERELRAKKLRTLAVKNARLPQLRFVAAYPTSPSNFVAASIAALARDIAKHSPQPQKRHK